MCLGGTGNQNQQRPYKPVLKVDRTVERGNNKDEMCDQQKQQAATAAINRTGTYYTLSFPSSRASRLLMSSASAAIGGAHPSASSGAVAAMYSAAAAAAAALLFSVVMLSAEAEMPDACVPADFPERPVSGWVGCSGIAAGEIRFRTT